MRRFFPGRSAWWALVLALLLAAGCLDTRMPTGPGMDVPAGADAHDSDAPAETLDGTAGCSDACGVPGCDVPGCPGGDACPADTECCVPRAAKQCFGDAVHWVDSCGVKGEQIVLCKAGCEDGQCLNCQPECEGKECGDDGCGGECGACDDGLDCTQDSCDSDLCRHDLTAGCLIDGDCVDKGANQPGNDCMECVPDQSKDGWSQLEDGTPCDDLRTCKAGTCECALTSCGAGCCGDGELCVGGECCAPDCTGKECGDDGCGGSCGQCPELKACKDGACGCQFDSCVEVCCPEGEVCFGDLCCVPQCEGKECGDNACGGSCGNCAPGQVCLTGVCPAEGKECDDGNGDAWDGCTDGMLSEFLVPQSIAGDQDGGASAFLADGAVVVAWRDTGNDYGLGDVLARRFLPDGTAGNAEPVNAAGPGGIQTSPQVAALANGNVVVAWESCPDGMQPDSAQDSSACGVYARRFGPGLAPLQAEFQVNTTTTDQQRSPSVASLTGGNFLIVWESCPPAGDPGSGQDGSGCGIFGQLFTADGQPSLGEFGIPLHGEGEQFAPSATALADGGFVVVWQGAGPGDSAGVFGRVYSSQGVPGDKQFTLSDKVSNTQESPEVVPNGSGFVAAWESWGQDGDGYGVFGQLFAANGAKLGAEIAWSSTTSGNQRYPRLAELPEGIAAGWSDWGLDGDGGAVVLRTFDAAAKPTGKEIVANKYVAGDQKLSSVAAAQDGTIVMVWSGKAPDGFGSSVYARRFAADGKALYH